MYDFGIDLGASFTKVACVRRIPEIDTYADPIFNCSDASPLDVGLTYWYPGNHHVTRSFLVPTVVLCDRREADPEVRIGARASEMYARICEYESRHRQTHQDDDRRIPVYPFFNWKKRFISEADQPCAPQPDPDKTHTWMHVGTEFLRRLRLSVGDTHAPSDATPDRPRLTAWLNHPDAHTRICLPLTPYAREHRNDLENRMRASLRAAGWPVMEGRKVVSWEGTANLLGRMTRGRNRLLANSLPDVEGIFRGYGFARDMPKEGWTCMAIDVGHYTTDVAVYRYQKDGVEFQNPSAMDEVVFTRSEEVGVASHLDVRVNQWLEGRRLSRQNALRMLTFKQLWTAARANNQRPTEAASVLEIPPQYTDAFIEDASRAYSAFADDVSTAVAAAMKQCEQTWSNRVDAIRFPHLHINMIYLSGGVMEAPDLRQMVIDRVRRIPACMDSVFDSPDAPAGANAARKWNTRLRSACAAGAVSVLGESQD